MPPQCLQGRSAEKVRKISMVAIDPDDVKVRVIKYVSDIIGGMSCMHCYHIANARHALTSDVNRKTSHIHGYAAMVVLGHKTCNPDSAN